MTDEILERAMQLRAKGISWRAAARELGVANGDLWRACAIRGIGGAGDTSRDDPEGVRQRKAQIRDRWFHIAIEAADQLADALDQQQIPPTSLPIVAGIASDKLALADRWREPAVREHDWLAGIAEKLASIGGGTASLTIEVEPARIVEAKLTES